MNNDFEMIKHRNGCYKRLEMRVVLWSDVYAVVVVCLLVVPRLSDAGGRLLQPAARSSLWRVGLSTTVLYQDHQLSCGGFQRHWIKNKGKCGVCGDPYEGAREHEAGGMYASGVIAATYQQGQVIDVLVEITAHQQGWFEFRICANNNIHSAVEQRCLNKHTLPLANSGETRLYITGQQNRLFRYKLKLPDAMTCEQCVIQWKYHTGNSWQCNKRGRCGLGLGPQEEFYGCSDVTIVKDFPKMAPDTTTKRTTTKRTTPQPGTCVPRRAYRRVPGMYHWCATQCGDPQRKDRVKKIQQQNERCKGICACPRS